MIPAISNIAWTPEERRDAYAVMADHSIPGLEIAPGLFFHASDDPFAPDALAADAALAEIAEAGLSLVSMQSLLFGTQGAALFGDADALDRLETGMHRAIDLADRFGIPNLVFGSPKQRQIPSDMTHAAAVDRAASVFRRLGDRAVAAGTRIAMEANPEAYGTNFLNRLEEAADFVARTDHDGVTLILDLGMMHMNGAFDDIPFQVTRVAQKLSHVHVSEPNLAPAPADATDLRAMLTALSRAGYDKAVSIEMLRPDDGLAGLDARAAAFAAALRAEVVS